MTTTGNLPVLLVMGLGMPGHLWGPVRERLEARGHRVATYDHRGLGAREALAPLSDMPALADDLREVLDAQGWSRSHLVGISMGGMIAQEFAVRHPHRVSSLALVATTAWAGGLVPPTLEAVWAALTVRDRPQRLAHLLFPPDWRAAHAEHVQRRTEAMTMGRPETVRAHLRAVAGHDARRRLATLRMPVLVVKAGRDILIRPSNADTLAACVPGARLETLAAAGHGVIAQEPDRLATLLSDHAQRAEAR